MTKILDGKLIAAKIKEEIRHKIKNNNLSPCLAVCLVGNDVASEIYVHNKRKACDEVGIKTIFQQFPIHTHQNEIIEWINFCTSESHGILVQLPLPSTIDKNSVINHIPIEKDVDCFHPTNQGLLMTGKPNFYPCTPMAVLTMLQYYEIPIKSKQVVIINDSIIVGRPLAMMLLNEKATVTVCHEHTKDLKSICLQADIIVTAVGKINFRLPGSFVKNGSVVVDVGIFRENGRIRGDVIFDEVSQKTSWLSKVPGGCGVCTVQCLLKNTVQACQLPIS